MRRKLIFALLGVICNTAYAQTDSISPEDYHLMIDSVNPSFFQQKTEIIIHSLFGESRKLSNADSIINEFDALPSFGIYKDNYWVTGTEMFKGADRNNSDAKFQVSIRQRLTNSILPFKTHIFLTYTQKAFWDIYKESFPFRDLNFNPTLGIGKALVYNNRLLGALTFQFEHESNGKDGENSRSWNKIAFGSVLTFNDYWSMQAKVWVPIVDGGNNKDIVNYSGWMHWGVDYIGPRKKYSTGLLITRRGGAMLDANITFNFSLRLFNDDNQYLFLEYYNGYGESMLDYTQYRNRIRLGIVIKPTFMNLY